MENAKIDCCFVITLNSALSYQGLSKDYSAIEPPTWALLLAQSARAVENKVYILDANAESLNEKQILDRLIKLSPRLICFVVYYFNTINHLAISKNFFSFSVK